MPGSRPPQERPGDARVLDCLYRVGAFVNETEDPREALDFILAEIVRTLGASSASIALVEPTSMAGVWTQRLTGLGAVVLPWLGLMRLRQAGAHPMPWLIAALLCGLVWLLVTASDHNRLAFDRNRQAIVLQRGWAGGLLTESVWPLQSVLICEDGRLLSQRESPTHRARLAVRPHIDPSMTSVLGGPRQLERWLGRLIVALGGVPVAMPRLASAAGNS